MNKRMLSCFESINEPSKKVCLKTRIRPRTGPIPRNVDSSLAVINSVLVVKVVLPGSVELELLISNIFFTEILISQFVCNFIAVLVSSLIITVSSQ